MTQFKDKCARDRALSQFLLPHNPLYSVVNRMTLKDFLAIKFFMWALKKGLVIQQVEENQTLIRVPYTIFTVIHRHR